MTNAVTPPDETAKEPPDCEGSALSATWPVHPGLTVTFLVLLLAFSVVMASSWDTTGRRVVACVSDEVMQIRTAFWRWRCSLRDPRPGTILPEPRRVAGDAGRGVVEVVVFAEGGLTCCGGKAGALAAMVGQMAQKTAACGDVRWTIVIGGEEALPPAEPERKSRKLYSVVQDRAGMLGKRYNAYFTPRTYILRDRALQWAEPPSASEEELTELMPTRTIVEHVRRAAKCD